MNLNLLQEKMMEKDITNRLNKMSKTEKDKETVKPTVINDKLIKNYIIMYNKENQIYNKDDEPIWSHT